LVTKKKASFYSKKNLSAKPKSVGKSKISFDFEQQFTERKGPEPKDLEYVYKSYPLAFQGINLIADECVARGFEILHESEDVRKEIDDWMDEVNFKEKLYDAIVNTLVFGDGYFEVVFDPDGTTIDELVVMDSTVVDFLKDSNGSIIFDPSGNPKSYVQKTGSMASEDDINFKPEEIAHFTFYTLRGQRKGISLFNSVIRSITHAMNTDNSVAQAIYRHGFAQFDISVGNDLRRPTKEQIDAITSDVKDLQVTSEYVHSDDIAVNVLEAKNTRGYEKYSESFIRNIVSGMGIPAPLLLGTGESSNKSTADVQSRHFRSMIETIQNKVKSVVEDKIFKRLQNLNGWTKSPMLEWNEVLPEEESAKVARVASLFEQGIVTRTEAREMVGLPPLSDFGDLKPSAVTVQPVFPANPNNPQDGPEKSGPKQKNEPRAPEKSVVPPFNRTQPSEKGRSSLSECTDLNSLKVEFKEDLDHYFDSLRSSTLNKIVSFNELSEEKSLAMPLDRVSKELSVEPKELGSIMYNYMKEATKLGLNDSGCLELGENALLSGADADYLDNYVEVLSKKQMDDVFNKINWIVLDAFAKHEHVDNITTKINDVFFKYSSFGHDASKQVKSDLLAVDNSNRAYNNGLLMGFTKKGVETLSLVREGCETCAICNSTEYDSVPIESARGLLPLHPNCSCSFTPK